MNKHHRMAVAAVSGAVVAAGLLAPSVQSAATEQAPSEAKGYNKPAANCYKARYRTRPDGMVKKINTGEIVKRPLWGTCDWLVVEDGGGGLPVCSSYREGVCPFVKISKWISWNHQGAHALGFVPQPQQSKQWTTYAHIYLSEPAKWYTANGRRWVFNKVTVKPIRVVPVGGY